MWSLSKAGGCQYQLLTPFAGIHHCLTSLCFAGCAFLLSTMVARCCLLWLPSVFVTHCCRCCRLSSLSTAVLCCCCCYYCCCWCLPPFVGVCVRRGCPSLLCTILLHGCRLPLLFAHGLEVQTRSCKEFGIHQDDTTVHSSEIVKISKHNILRSLM